MPECSPDKLQQYERLRSQAIDDCRIPGSVTMVSTAVLLRQGMGVWMQLRGSDAPASSLDAVDTGQRQSTLPVPVHAELLAVLCGLVFNIRSQKESA
jgi:hypothetical protein